MRRLIRIMAGAALVSAFVFVNSPPVAADHDSPDGTGWPCTTEDHLPPPLGCDGDAYHEEMPDIAIVEPDDVCVVQGGILASDPTENGPQHLPAIPLVNENPAHSHYAFVGDNSINCLFQGNLRVESDGGNDGHMIDILDPVFPIAGPNGDPAELDPLDDCIVLPPLFDEDNPCPGNDPFKPNGGDDHDFNDHHGSVNESAWSNSSGYSLGQGGGESNLCFNNVNNQNKADITANESLGWLKYIRIGVVVDVWGCFYAGPLAGKHFNALIVLLANPADPGAAFDLVGVAALGNAWLVDEQPPT